MCLTWDDDGDNDEKIIAQWECIFKMITCKVFHHKYKSDDTY